MEYRPGEVPMPNAVPGHDMYQPGMGGQAVPSDTTELIPEDGHAEYRPGEVPPSGAISSPDTTLDELMGGGDDLVEGTPVIDDVVSDAEAALADRKGYQSAGLPGYETKHDQARASDRNKQRRKTEDAQAEYDKWMAKINAGEKYNQKTFQKVKKNLERQQAKLAGMEEGEYVSAAAGATGPVKDEAGNQVTAETTSGSGTKTDTLVNEVADNVNPNGEPGPGSDQAGENVDPGVVEETGGQADEKDVEKSEGFLKGLFGDLLDSNELKRMAIMYTGSRLLGYGHGGSLEWAAKQYVGRVDAKTAAFDQLVASGKYTPESLAAYKKSGNPGDLIVPGAAPELTGEFKTFFGPGGKKQRAQKIKLGDQTYWQTQDGRQVDANWSEDAASVRGTPEYSKRISEDTKLYGGMVEDLRKQFGTTKGKDNQTIYATQLAPSVSGGKIAKWAAENNVSSDVAASVVENAYHSALEHGKNTGEKVRDLTPFLNEQYVIAKVGDANLFRNKDGKAVDAVGVNKLFREVTQSPIAKGKDLTTTQILQAYRGAWNNLTDGERKQWEAKATETENGFMKFVRDDVIKANS